MSREAERIVGSIQNQINQGRLNTTAQKPSITIPAANPSWGTGPGQCPGAWQNYQGESRNKLLTTS